MAGDDDPESLLVERELRRALEVACAELDAGSAEAIAAMLGDAPVPSIAPATFRKRVSRAVARLRAMLATPDSGGTDV